MTRKDSYRHTTTIQTWPGGQSFTFRGDPDGPPNQRSLRVPGRLGSGEPDSPWRKGTDDEWRTIRVAIRAEMYASRDVLTCDSALVDDLIKMAGRGELGASSETRELARAFEYDAIENIYADPSEWTLEQCRDYLNDHGVDEPDACDPWIMTRAELVETLTNISIETKDDETDETLREAVIANVDDETIDGLDDWRDACREHAQENPAEVYEWWRVSGWLCEELRKSGEVVLDNGYGHWWGRTCTGQGLIMDGTLQTIAGRYDQ